MYSKTDLINILRIYGYSFTALASELGITKSYISKIINGQVSSPKYKKLIQARAKNLLKTRPENVNKNAPRWERHYFKFPAGIKDIALCNAIQDILDKKNLTITQLAKEINEARSSVSQVIIGLRPTKRIREKIINYLGLDKEKFFARTYGEMDLIHKGVFVPLPTKEKLQKGKNLLKKQ
ncbi:MAG: helix-turn-helix domain-containing protein [Treponema sp.]|nr:helix-turn-helix domain-containing protein [Treponema sp.]